MVLLDPCKADVQFGQLPPPRHLEYVVTSIGDLGAAARDWVSERTDYPRNVAQLALRMKPIAASSMSTSTGRPKNSVSNYANAEGTANERQEL